MVKFNSARQERSIEGCNISVSQLEAKFLNYTKKGLFYVFFRIYGTGSGGENRKWSNLSSRGQNLSIEGCYIIVGQFSDFLEGLISVSAHCG